MRFNDSCYKDTFDSKFTFITIDNLLHNIIMGDAIITLCINNKYYINFAILTYIVTLTFYTPVKREKY